MLPQTGYDEASVALARLLNQDSIPASESGRVAFFIASGIQRILRAFDFDQQKIFASVTTDVNGRVSLAALKLGMTPGIILLTNGTQDYKLVTPSDRYHYTSGNYYYNVVVENGAWILYTSEANATVTIGYFDSPDTVTASSVPTPVKVALQPMVIAKAALIYYRQAQDPEADTEQEEDQFRQEIAEISEAQERRRPQKFITTRRDTYNHQIGYTGNGRRNYGSDRR